MNILSFVLEVAETLKGLFTCRLSSELQAAWCPVRVDNEERF